jgi:hypothetical protein
MSLAHRDELNNIAVLYKHRLSGEIFCFFYKREPLKLKFWNSLIYKRFHEKFGRIFGALRRKPGFAGLWQSNLRLPRLRALTPVIQKISGLFLILIGLLMMLGRFKTLNSFLLKTGYALAGLARDGGWPARIVPALVFILIALAPPLFRFFRKRPVFSRGLCIFSGLFAVLALFQLMGLLDVPALLSRWFLYMGL